MPVSAPMKLGEASVVEIREGLEQGRFTSRTLVETYIRRIRQLNPYIHAVSEINPDATKIAEAKDIERAEGRACGSLHGIPVLVQDVFLTTDRLRTSFGCTGLLDAKPTVEATAIQRMREEGAILLGKTVLTEWADYRSPRTAPGGWSPFDGQCLAPYHEDQDPSGSSSGSAVAVALGLAPFALAIETSKSISCSAEKSAVVGITPTVGLTSRYGTLAINEYQDTVGVLAKTVRDAATLLSVVAGPDSKDPFTLSYPNDPLFVRKPLPNTDFAAACDREGLSGRRFAVPRHLFGNEDAEVNKAFDKALGTLKKFGAEIVDNVAFSEFSSSYTVCDSEQWELSQRVLFRNNIARVLAMFRKDSLRLRNLADVIKHTRKTPEEEVDRWGIEEFVAAERTGRKYDVHSPEFEASLDRRHRIGKQIPELLDRCNCDFIVTPCIDTSANVGGCPTVAVPLGFYNGDTPIKRRKSSGLVTQGPFVPYGLLFVGRRFDDERLISAAHSFEQATPARLLVNPIIASDIELPVPPDESESKTCL